MLRKFDPLKEDHPLVDDICPVCSNAFLAGDEVTLIATHPVDQEEAKKAQQGKAYNAVAQPVHWWCRG
jgi:hypothetical protein